METHGGNLMHMTKWNKSIWKGCIPCESVSHLVISDSLWPHGPHQAPLSMEFSWQEYWSRLSFPSPVDFPNPGIEPGSPALQADSLPSEPPGNMITTIWHYGKGKIMETVKRSVVVAGRQDEQVVHRIFRAVKILCMISSWWIYVIHYMYVHQEWTLK